MNWVWLSETSVSNYKSTRREIPEERLHPHVVKISNLRYIILLTISNSGPNLELRGVSPHPQILINIHFKVILSEQN